MLEAAVERADSLAAHATRSRRLRARDIYFSLLRECDGPGRIHELARASSRLFLADRLAAASTLPDDLPGNPQELAAWLEEDRKVVAQSYRDYLDARKSGAPRRYFGSRSHALYFLQGSAPTKLVDGAWLYGLLSHSNDPRFAALIRIYLDELGEGHPDRNHVVIYRKLLREHGCDGWDRLDDEFFTQGAIQLSLAHHAADFLPETIGFNLGYELLPLHLLITAYELAELDLDPYYFTLHVTVDNASTGHARKSLEAVADAIPRLGDSRAFYRRVANGFRLNMLGMGATDIIDSFDLEQEMSRMCARKAVVGAQMHSDYCRIGGRTVNEWLSEPQQMPAFLETLASTGWVRRHEDPSQSRFWNLLAGDAAPMFGVFSAYEQQLIHDWIAGDLLRHGGEPNAVGSALQRPVRRFRRRPLPASDGEFGSVAPTLSAGASVCDLVEANFGGLEFGRPDDFDSERQLLKQTLKSVRTREELTETLRCWLSPASHHTTVGLAATRMFACLFSAQT